VGPEQRDDLVVRQRLGHAALAADDAFGAPGEQAASMVRTLERRSGRRPAGRIRSRPMVLAMPVV
jgi:hypothetical protein